MKLKKLLTNTLLTSCTLLLFSCHNSLELIKKRYSPGYYVAFSGDKEKKNPVPAHANHTADSIVAKPFVHSAANTIKPPVTHPNFLKPAVSNSENLTASIAKIETRRPKEQNLKPPHASLSIHEQNYPYHFLPSSPYPDDVSPVSAIPLSYKIAAIFLLLSLLSLVCIFAGALFAIQPLLIIGGFFPELWLTGIILAIIGLIKHRKIPDAITSEPRRPDKFSHAALILGVLELILLLPVVIATFFVLHSFTPLAILVSLFFILFLISFVLSVVGLIRVLKDPLQTKKNRLKAILISIFSLLPICLMLAWFAAVASFLTAIVSAVPYFAIALFIMHG